MSNAKPDVLEILSENILDKPFPARSDFRIAIAGSAHKGIIDHSKEDPKNEICGILIGEVFKDINGPYLDISAIIKGKYADNQAGNVTFTHETWEYINSVKDEHFSNKLIVGWYHTHPRFGIFLSEQDVFIHKNFFDKPWQVAFVVDPIAEEEGFFIWRQGIPEKTMQYWLDGNEIIVSEAVKKLEGAIVDKTSIIESEKINGKNKNRLWDFIFGFTFILFIVLAILYYWRVEIKTFINNQFNYDKRQIEVSSNDLFKKLIDSKLVEHLSFVFNPNENKIYFAGDVYTIAKKESLNNLLKTILKYDEYYDIQNVIVTHSYTIKPGETLSQISDNIYGNPNLGKAVISYQTFHFLFIDTTKSLSYFRLYLPELK